MILIEESEVVACLFKGGGNLFVSKPKGWNGKDKEDLLAALDSSRGECLSSAGNDQGPQETIFILSPFWVDDKGEILETRKQILKEVCQFLSLSPLGFLVGDEALAQYFDSFVSICFSQKHFVISVVQSGEVEARDQVEDGVGVEFEELVMSLEKMKVSTSIPQKLIFWGRIDQKLREEIISYQWEKKKVFDQRPEIEIFSWVDFFDHLARIVSREKLSEVRESEVREREVKPEPNFGFVADDVAVSGQPEIDKQKLAESMETIQQEPKTEKVTKKRFSLKLPQFSFSLAFLKSLFARKGILVLSSALGLALMTLILSWYFSKSTVEIFITPEVIAKKIEVQMDPSAKEFDLEKGIIPVEQLEMTLEGEKTEPTTGEKLIGEKAKGEVTVYNRTSDSKTFEAGTILNGPGGLKFILDDEVSVASKTADLVSGVDRWGEVKVVIAAVDIGAEYNLAADSVFSIADYSDDDFLAKNPESLSGGSSRQIRAVSEEDQENVKKLLIKELSSEAKKKLKIKPSEGQILGESLQTEVIDADYTAAVGDEEDVLGLKLKLRAKVAKLSNERLDQLAREVLKKEANENFKLDQESIEVDLNVKETGEDGVIFGEMNLKAKAYPQIDREKIAGELAAKKRTSIQQLIRSYPRIYRYQVIFKPGLFKLFGFLSPQARNINIEIKE